MEDENSNKILTCTACGKPLTNDSGICHYCGHDCSVDLKVINAVTKVVNFIQQTKETLNPIKGKPNNQYKETPSFRIPNDKSGVIFAKVGIVVCPLLIIILSIIIASFWIVKPEGNYYKIRELDVLMTPNLSNGSVDAKYKMNLKFSKNYNKDFIEFSTAKPNDYEYSSESTKVISNVLYNSVQLNNNLPSYYLEMYLVNKPKRGEELLLEFNIRYKKALSKLTDNPYYFYKFNPFHSISVKVTNYKYSWDSTNVEENNADINSGLLVWTGSLKAREDREIYVGYNPEVAPNITPKDWERLSYSTTRLPNMSNFMPSSLLFVVIIGFLIPLLVISIKTIINFNRKEKDITICPYCGKKITKDATYCPSCEQYVPKKTENKKSKSYKD